MEMERGPGIRPNHDTCLGSPGRVLHKPSQLSLQNNSHVTSRLQLTRNEGDETEESEIDLTQTFLGDDQYVCSIYQAVWQGDATRQWRDIGV
jgi:hypothetical protein